MLRPSIEDHILLHINKKPINKLLYLLYFNTNFATSQICHYQNLLQRTAKLDASLLILRNNSSWKSVFRTNSDKQSRNVNYVIAFQMAIVMGIQIIELAFLITYNLYFNKRFDSCSNLSYFYNADIFRN